MPVKVSVVVPVFNPGEHIDPLIASLDRQTLPASEFETIFVDDGSSDDTPDKLERLAAERDNVTLIRIPNSGWPGRPRNLGVDAARGEYVQFVDHDDELGPEALERMYAYARENGSDVVVGKEVRRTGRWHAVPLFDKNRPRATLRTDPLLGILTPHKMFRREFLNKHRLRFFEGPRRMEDHPFVVEAFFLAEVVSVLSDYPVYYWNRRPDRKNAGARPFDWAEYYVYMRDVLDVVERYTEPGEFRDRLLAFWYDSKGLGIVARNAGRVPAQQARAHFDALRALAEERFPPSVDNHLHGVMKARSALLRANDFAGMVSLSTMENGIHVDQTVTTAHVDGDALVLRLRVGLAYADGSPVVFEHAGGTYRWRPPIDLGDAVPVSALDFTRSYSRRRLELALRSRSSSEIVLVPATVHSSDPGAGEVPFLFDVAFSVDPRTLSGGRPLDRGVYDLFVRVTCIPWRPHAPLQTSPRSAVRTPMTDVLSVGLPAVLFAKKGGGLALDIGQKALDLLELAAPRLTAATVVVHRGAVVVRMPVEGFRMHGGAVKGPARLHRREGGDEVRGTFRLSPGRDGKQTWLRVRVPLPGGALPAGEWDVVVGPRRRQHPLPIALQAHPNGTVHLRHRDGEDDHPAGASSPRPDDASAAALPPAGLAPPPAIGTPSPRQAPPDPRRREGRGMNNSGALTVETIASYAHRVDDTVRLVLEVPEAPELAGPTLRLRRAKGGPSVTVPATVSLGPSGTRIEAGIEADRLPPGVWHMWLRPDPEQPQTRLQARLVSSRRHPIALLPGPAPRTSSAPAIAAPRRRTPPAPRGRLRQVAVKSVDAALARLPEERASRYRSVIAGAAHRLIG